MKCKCPHCSKEYDKKVKPTVMNVMFVDDGPRLRAVGFINNREFIFFTDDDRREWWYEMSLNPFINVNVCNKGDGVWWGVTNKWEAERPMDRSGVNLTIRAIIKNLVESGLLDRDNYDSFKDQGDLEGFDGEE